MHISRLPALALLLSVAPAQQPGLVLDINRQGAPASSNPIPGTLAANGGSLGYVTIGLYTYFAADDGKHGVELHRTLGRPGTTERLVDIRPGLAGGGLHFPAVLGTLLVFGADDGVAGNEPWVFDTVTKRARRLADLNPGVGGSNPQQMTAIGNYVFFKAQAPGLGDELYRTDGTPAGTILLKDINPGVGNSRPIYFAGLGGKAYFTAGEPNSGRELWVSDGTPAGTSLFKDIVPGPNGSQLTQLTTWNGAVWFNATGAGGGYELWRCDGTVQGTVMAFDLEKGGGSSHPAYLTPFAGALYFSAQTSATGRELYRTDGRTVQLVHDAIPGATGGGAAFLTPVGSGANARLFYNSAIEDPVTKAPLGTELCCYDGSKVVEIDLNPGAAHGAPMYHAGDGGGRLFFRAIDPVVGNELWVSDGTKAGTRLVADIKRSGGTNPSLNSSFPFYLTRLPIGGVIFSADDGTAAGRELWFSDGTAAGTRMIADINVAPRTDPSLPRDLEVLGDAVYFSADDGIVGRELWRSDGTAGGTRLVADLAPGAAGSDPTDFVLVGDLLFCSADAPHPRTGNPLGRELWIHDLRTGTSQVVDIVPGSAGSEPFWLEPVGGLVYFRAATASGKELWVSDGSVPGTRLVRDIAPGAADSNPLGLTAFRGRLWFTAAAVAGDVELWSTDGSSAGTRREFDINPGSAGSHPLFLTSLGNRLVFRAYAPAVGLELFATDGKVLTPIDVQPGGLGSFPATGTGLVTLGRPRPFSVANGVLYFAADDGANGSELWRSDGTPAGTRMVVDLNPKGSGRPTSIGACEGGVLFGANDGKTGVEPWFSDGTAAGTRQLADLVPGALSSGASGFAALGSRHSGFLARVYDVQNNRDLGYELLRTDRTTAGTKVFDLNPGGSSFARELSVVRGRLVFVADDGAAGYELFALDLGASGLPDARGCGASANALHATDPVLGGTTAVRLRAARPNTGGVLAFGLPTARGLHVGGGCEFWTDFGVGIVTFGLRTDATGGFGMGLPVPNDNTLSGLRVVVQAAIGPTATVPLGLDLSNPVVLRLGR